MDPSHVSFMITLFPLNSLVLGFVWQNGPSSLTKVSHQIIAPFQSRNEPRTGMTLYFFMLPRRIAKPVLDLCQNQVCIIYSSQDVDDDK